jgi:hypothetical protein
VRLVAIDRELEMPLAPTKNALARRPTHRRAIGSIRGLVGKIENVELVSTKKPVCQRVGPSHEPKSRGHQRSIAPDAQFPQLQGAMQWKVLSPYVQCAWHNPEGDLANAPRVTGAPAAPDDPRELTVCCWGALPLLRVTETP